MFVKIVTGVAIELLEVNLLLSTRGLSHLLELVALVGPTLSIVKLGLRKKDQELLAISPLYTLAVLLYLSGLELRLLEQGPQCFLP